MTVKEHHELCIGMLACCYQHVPDGLKAAIIEGCEAAKAMGMNIKPENLHIMDAMEDDGWLCNRHGWWHPPSCLAAWPFPDAKKMWQRDKAEQARQNTKLRPGTKGKHEH